MKSAGNKIPKIFEQITGKNLDMNSYEHRLMIQKLIYLMQKAGANYDYYFSWYIKGPYSPELTKECFDVFGRKIDKNPPLSGEEEKFVSQIKKSFSVDATSDKGLELLGSLVFVIKDMNTQEKEEAVEKLHDLKPWYKKQEISSVYDKIAKSSLFA